MPLTFFVIILAQLVIFLLVCIQVRDKVVITGKDVLLSALFGLILGITFDILLGFAGVFTYVGGAPQSQELPWKLSTIQLVCNGIFSYGLTVLTVRLIVLKSYLVKNQIERKRLGIFAVSIMAIFIVLVINSSSLVSLFLYGALIVTIGEFIMIIFSRTGPVLSLIIKREYSLFFRVWVKILIIGFLYELTNWIYPFWVFLPGETEYSHFLIESIIVLFGYVALFHPMIIFWQIMEER